MPLQWLARRPEPDGEAELRAMHDGAGGHRGLLVATGAFKRECLGLERPGLHTAASRANEAVRPAGFDQIINASALIGKALLKRQKRRGIVRHGRQPEFVCSYFVLHHRFANVTICRPTGRSGISLPRQSHRRSYRRQSFSTRISLKS